MIPARSPNPAFSVILGALLVLALAAAPAAVSAATYYVSTTGSDSNSGSSTSPWRTLWHAVRSINSGDTIRMLPGTYRPTETPTVYNRDNVTITADTLPAWLEFTDNGDGTAQLTGTPEQAHLGDHAVTLTVEDGGGQTDEQSFTLRVAAEGIFSDGFESGDTTAWSS